MSKPPVVHLVLPRESRTYCRTAFQPPETRWTYQVALTTCKRCLKAEQRPPRVR